MRRQHTPAALLAVLTLLGACVGSDPVAPTPPRATGGLSLALGPALPSCDPSGVRQTMATLYPTNIFKQVALPAFNSGEQSRQAGDFAAARTWYFTLIADLIERYKDNVLQTPSLQESTQLGVVYVVSGVLACAGDETPENLDVILEKIAGRLANPPLESVDLSYEICVVLDVAEEQPCFVPTRRAATLLDATFLRYEALILMEPDTRAGDPYAPVFGTTWSAHWRIRVAPIEAQTNYPGPATGSAPLAGAAFCVDDHSHTETNSFHAPPSALRVAQDPEEAGANELLPRANDPDLFLLLTPGCQVKTNETLVSLTNPLGDSYLARRTWQLATRAGSAIGSLLTPAAAHAFDGGAGGRLTSFTSFFAAVEEPKLHIRLTPPDTGTRDTVRIKTQTPTLYFASRTRYGAVVAPAPDPALDDLICEWTSSHNRVVVSPTPGDSGVTATLTTTRSTGEAWIHVTCEDDDLNGITITPAPRDSMLVVVVR